MNRVARPGRPRILVVTDWYLPGRKGGGTVRSLVNLVDWLGDEFEFAGGDPGPGAGRRPGPSWCSKRGMAAGGAGERVLPTGARRRTSVLAAFSCGHSS